MKKLLTIFAALMIITMVLAACGPAATPAPEEPAAPVEEVQPTEAPVEEAPTEAPAEAEPTEAPAEPAAGKTQVRWFVGLGTGTNPDQIAVQEEVVADFNASQDEIELVLEVVPYDSARDTLSTQIASGAGPDVVGPVGWGGSNDFYGQWLDIGPYIDSSGFDTSIFDPALIKFYQTEEGQVGLPFAVFPGAMYFVPAMFDEAGLNYPPQVYGDPYVWPDGTEAEWNWDTVTELAKKLTVDVNGVASDEEGFDRNNIVQLGYVFQWSDHPMNIGTFVAGATKIYDGEAEGSYTSAIPDSWKEAYDWYYNGIWGDQPFMATGALSGSPEFGNGNVFNSGKAAMGLTQTWYTCCLAEFRDAGFEFQLAVQPAKTADGVVSGRMDADTFRILKSSKNPEAAFAVLSYLITTGADKLLPTYGAMPAVAEKVDDFFAVKGNDYPFVTPESWDVFVQGLAYPDIPSAEQYQPNSIEAWARFTTFGDLMRNTPPDQFDLDVEFQKLVDDLNLIYNK